MTELRARLLSVIETWIPTKSMVIPSSSILAGSVWGILYSMPIFACWCFLLHPFFKVFSSYSVSVVSPGCCHGFFLVATTHIATDGSVVGIGEDPAPGD